MKVRRRHHSEDRARGLVRAAIKAGRLRRPAVCSACGVEPPPMRNGVSRIQGHHHEGYDKPLSVQWLCTGCHRAVTPYSAITKPEAQARGERIAQSKLTKQQVIEMRRQIRRHQLSYAEIGRRYGISDTAARSICLRIAWRHVDA